ncbi:MAG: family 10 glycosylhydrolase [Hydrococcus sp. RM1_1_31]|nr:family 10 glycosylhydrolase [Hydrococcus sp. RM1_1_31]
MEAVLNRYGIGRYNERATLVKQSQATDCNAEAPLVPVRQQAPILPQEQSRSLPRTPQTRSARQPLAPSSVTSPEQFSAPSTNLNLGVGFSPERVSAMDREIESLIARFESTLLAAQANNSKIFASTQDLVEQSLKSGAYASADTTALPQTSYANGLSHPAITEARARLEKFHQFVEQGDYTQARQQWIEARRTLWDNYPTDRQFAQSEMRAMWLDRGTIVKARSEADLAKVFDRMAQAGINTVFFETVNASYTIYPSRIAPEQNPLTKGWDPLKAAVKLAHERGMELHAWVWTFAAANQRHNLILNQPRNYLGPVLSRHPKWAITDKKGGVFDFTAQYHKAFLDPANPEVQRYLQALVEEIATQYDVDGIQFDYIRYPFQDPQRNQIFGYSEISRSQFKQQTGVDPLKISPSHPLWHQWTTYRVRQVDNFVATTSIKLKQKRPDLLVSVAVFPLPRQERLMRLQQNWEEWGQRGWVDATVLMTYALDTINLEETTKILLDSSSAGSSLLIPGLRLLSVPDPVTFDQLQLIYAISPLAVTPSLLPENFIPRRCSLFSPAPKVLPLPQNQLRYPIVNPFNLSSIAMEHYSENGATC